MAFRCHRHFQRQMTLPCQRLRLSERGVVKSLEICCNVDDTRSAKPQAAEERVRRWPDVLAVHSVGTGISQRNPNRYTLDRAGILVRSGIV